MQTVYIITGAAGHLASTIIRFLQSTECVIRGLLLRGETGIDAERVSYIYGDVTEEKSLEALFEGTEGDEVIVIHAAGLISIAATVTPRLYEVNVKGTQNVIRQCVRHGVKRLVYVSSVHAIPEAGEMATMTEAQSFSKDEVAGAYAKTKAEASQSVLDAVKNDGLDAVIVHPSGIIGSFDDGRNHIVQLISLYVRGKLPAGVTGGYDFVDVRDVAQGCIAAAKNGAKGECYILSNRYCTIKDLLEYSRLLTHGHRKICIPAQLAARFAPLFEWYGRIAKKRPLFTRYALETVAGNGLFSHDKATMRLKYHPRDLKQTVADTIKWLKNGPHGGALLP